MEFRKRLPSQDARMFSDTLYQDAVLFKTGGASAPDDFHKMSPKLPSFAPCAEPYISRIVDLGAKGGLMDAYDPRVTVSNPLAANDEKTPPASSQLAKLPRATQQEDSEAVRPRAGQLRGERRLADPEPGRNPVSRTPVPTTLAPKVAGKGSEALRCRTEEM